MVLFVEGSGEWEGSQCTATFTVFYLINAEIHVRGLICLAKNPKSCLKHVFLSWIPVDPQKTN